MCQLIVKDVVARTQKPEEYDASISMNALETHLLLSI